LILCFAFNSYSSLIAFPIGFFPIDPIILSMVSYYNIIERLIVAADDNPPIGTTGTTAIVVMMKLTDSTMMPKT
jgi:hypothetical protein